MDDILNNSSRLNSFIIFCKHKHCEENIFFWKSVNEFKLLNNSSKQKQLAYKLYKTYIENGAISQLNLDEPVVLDIQNKINKNDISKDLFNDAIKYVKILMELDTLPAFKRYENMESIKKQILEIGGFELKNKFIHNDLPKNKQLAKYIKQVRKDSL